MRLLYTHIFPLVLAGIVGFFVAPVLYTGWDKPQVALASSHKHVPDIKAGTNAREIVDTRVKKGGLLILGSSELDQNLTYLPYRYFNSQHQMVTAVGHAGNQSLLMHATLMPYAGHLEGVKIAVLLSPTWFTEYAEGTNPANFAKNISEKDLYEIFYNPNLREKDRQALAAYIATHYAGFADPHIILSLFNAMHKTKKQWLNLPSRINLKWMERYAHFKYENYIHTQKSLNTDSLYALVPFDPAQFSLNMDSVSRAEVGRFMGATANNKMYLDSSYYRLYIKNESEEIGRFDYRGTQEWTDFVNLVDFLVYEKADVFFIFQPLNPYYYQHLERLQPLISGIKAELDKNGLDWYNLFVTGTGAYEPGILKDIMHLGEYGWLKVDSALIDHYARKRKHTAD